MMLSLVPSVVVTIGEPVVVAPAHQPTDIAGGDAAEILSAVIAPLPLGQPMPRMRAATKVPVGVVYATALCMIASAATDFGMPSCPPMPPRFARSTRYAAPSLPSAIASALGVAPGTSN